MAPACLHIDQIETVKQPAELATPQRLRSVEYQRPDGVPLVARVYRPVGATPRSP